MSDTNARAPSGSMVLVNGKVADAVPARDRGLAYGDGVFRTLPAREGRALHWGRHYAKLAHDCAALKLSVPAAALLEAEVKAACGNCPDAVVKIVITRGTGRRGYAYSADAAPTRLVFAEARADGAAHRGDGIRVRLCSLRLAHQPALAGVKHLNRLENVLARAEWSDPDIAEGLMSDVEGNIICGTMTNLFIVTRGVLATPRLDLCGVAGVTRERVLDAAARLELPCTVMTCTPKDILRADEVFLTNSVTGIRPVRDLDGVLRELGPITRTLEAELAREDDARVD